MKMTLQTTPPHANTMSAISQLLLIRFWWNFKGRFLGTSTTDHNCHADIWRGNICPGDICPYQEYLNCYWHDLDLTLKARLFMNCSFFSYDFSMTCLWLVHIFFIACSWLSSVYFISCSWLVYHLLMTHSLLSTPPHLQTQLNFSWLE